MGYFEKMMAIADADNDGENELIVSTRSDDNYTADRIPSKRSGNVFMY